MRKRTKVSKETEKGCKGETNGEVKADIAADARVKNGNVSAADSD